MARNAVMLEETKDTITVPAAFMIRMLACIHSLRNRRSTAATSNPANAPANGAPTAANDPRMPPRSNSRGSDGSGGIQRRRESSDAAGGSLDAAASGDAERNEQQH